MVKPFFMLDCFAFNLRNYLSSFKVGHKPVHNTSHLFQASQASDLPLVPADLRLIQIEDLKTVFIFPEPRCPPSFWSVSDPSHLIRSSFFTSLTLYFLSSSLSSRINQVRNGTTGGFYVRISRLSRFRPGSVVLSPLQVQTVLKKAPVAAQNQTEAILVSKKTLEYKWGMNVLGELTAAVLFAALCRGFP